MDRAVAEDETNGLVAVWHDESHWNRYLLDHPPDVELPPSYCSPEGWPVDEPARILALRKDHAAIRGLDA